MRRENCLAASQPDQPDPAAVIAIPSDSDKGLMVSRVYLDDRPELAR